ncbi:MAG: hypothetical protein ACR2LR_07975 [Hassallia sp.]
MVVPFPLASPKPISPTNDSLVSENDLGQFIKVSRHYCGAKVQLYWITGEEINDVVYFEEQIHSHHILPDSWCRKQGIDPKMYNCLMNLTPLSGKTNKRIGGKAPSLT